ncbi:phosphotransferase [Streptomyces prunicolor]|uniref:phosphotransferase n=1 Tax=Streptomyces prunicolor TaxID=67348 RepID=UPI00099821A2|nr:phosphotransferase [Streptomyces prunicolor]
MDAEELSACLRQFGLQARRPARPLPGGHVGSTVVVPTSQGTLAVKRFGGRFDAARTRLAAEAHQFAAIAGLAPPVRLTLSGQLTTKINDATYMITDYIDPACPPESTDFAVALAALHVRLEGFRPGSLCTDFLELPSPPALGLERILRRTQDKACREVIGWRLRILADYGLESKTVATTHHSWIHGDARPDNLLTTARTAGRHLFIDFDQVSRFPRPYEVVRGYVASVNPELPAHLLDRTFRSYLGAYHAITPISAADRALMIDLYITVQAAETRTFTTPEGEIRGMHAFAGARHQRLTWIIKHRDLLRRVAEEVRP